VLDDLGGGLIADNNMVTFYKDIEEKVDGDIDLLGIFNLCFKESSKIFVCDAKGEMTE